MYPNVDFADSIRIAQPNLHNSPAPEVKGGYGGSASKRDSAGPKLMNFPLLGGARGGFPRIIQAYPPLTPLKRGTKPTQPT